MRFTFPRPGERRNEPLVAIPERLLVNLVVLAGIGHLRDGCRSADCEVCANNTATLRVAGEYLTDEQLDLVAAFVAANLRGEHPEPVG